MFGIMDGVITAYDSQFCAFLGNIPDSKGCHAYSINEKNYTLVVANKKKLFLYGWQAPGFHLRKDFVLIDTAKHIHCINGSASVLVGYRRFYECIDLTSGSATRILDFEKEHKNITIDVSILCIFFSIFFPFGKNVNLCIILFLNINKQNQILIIIINCYY
jgi:hypothetical protein